MLVILDENQPPLAAGGEEPSLGWSTRERGQSGLRSIAKKRLYYQMVTVFCFPVSHYNNQILLTELANMVSFGYKSYPELVKF